MKLNNIYCIIEFDIFLLFDFIELWFCKWYFIILEIIVLWIDKYLMLIKGSSV